MELQKLIDGLKAHKSGAASYESVDEAIRVFEAIRDVDGEKVVKGLEELRNFADTDVHPVVSPDNWDIYSDLCDLIDEFGTDALAVIRQQQERIAELEAANASWQKFAPFLHAPCTWIAERNGRCVKPPKEDIEE
jgi:predicted nucleic acid-binding protein